MNIQENIAEMLKKHPINLSKLERILGIPPTTLCKFLSGKRKLPKKHIPKIVKYLYILQGDN